MVTPGLAPERQRSLMPVIELIKLDLPTLDLPKKAKRGYFFLSKSELGSFLEVPIDVNSLADLIGDIRRSLINR